MRLFIKKILLCHRNRNDNFPTLLTLELESFKNKWSYVPEATGTNKVLFTVTDSNGYSQSIEVTYEVEYAPFSVLLTKNANEFIINQDNEAQLNILREAKTAKEDNNIYTIDYTVSNGSGNFIVNDTLKAPGDTFKLKGGLTDLKYKPTTLGKHTIEVTAIAPDGAKNKTVLVVDVVHVSYNFTVNASSESMIVNQSNKLNFSLIEDKNFKDVTYSLSVSIVNGSGKFFDTADKEITQSNYFKIDKGNWFYNYIPDTPGKHELLFLLKDSNEQILERRVAITVEQTDFTFTAKPSNPTINLGDKNTINFNINPSSDKNNTTYKMQYSSNLNGSFVYNNFEYQSGVEFDVSEDAFSATFEPKVVGDYVLTFVVTDSNGVKKEATAAFKVENGDYTFSATPDPSEIFVSEESTLNFNLKQLIDNPNAKYEISYSLSGGQAELLNNGTSVSPGVYVPIEVGQTKWTFKPKTPGAFSVDFQIRDNTNNSKTTQITINVKEKDYTLSLVASKKSEFINVEIPINVNIKELAQNSNDTYQLFLASSKNGSVFYNGKEYTLGERFSVPANDFIVNYEGKEQGTHNITFTVISSSNVTKSKDVQVAFNEVDYNFNANSEFSEIIVGQKSKLNFNVFETGGSSTYEMAFFIQNTQAKIFDQNGLVIQAGNYVSVPKGNFSWTFWGTNEGTADMTFKIRNATGNEKEASISIIVRPKDYTFTAAAAKSSAFVNESIDINTNITEKGLGGESFTAIYSSTNTGRISYNGIQYAPGESFPIEKGNQTLTYKGLSQGEHNIKIVVRSSSGKEKEQSVVLTFNKVDYSFTAGASDNDLNLGESTSLNFNVSESGGSSTYEMAVFIQNTGGRILDHNGNHIQAGNYISVPKGNFSWTFESTNEGTAELTFKIRNATANEKEATVSIIVRPKDYTFTATAAKNSAFVNETVGVNIDISELGVGGDTYDLYYSTSSNGRVEYNGETISPGVRFSIPVGATSLNYIGTKDGKHDITFTATSSSNVIKSKSVSITYNQIDFSFNAAGASSTITQGEITDINFNISESGGTSDYTLRVQYSGNSGEITDQNGNKVNPGQLIDVPKGNFKWQFKGTNVGTVNMTFYARNATGKEKEQEVTIKVEKKDFNFSVIAQKTSAFVNEPIRLNATISELGAGGDTYEVYYSSSNSGKITYKGNDYYPGQRINPFDKGTSSLTYTGLTEGTHNIEFYAVSSSNVTKTANISLRYNKYLEPFSFTANAQNGPLIEGEEFDITINANATNSHDPNVTYNVVYEFDGASIGSIQYNGTIYNSGDIIPIAYGTSSMRYIPKTTQKQDDFTLTFNAANSTGETAKDTENIDIYLKPIAWGKVYFLEWRSRGTNEYGTGLVSVSENGTTSKAFNGANIAQITFEWFSEDDKKHTQTLNYNTDFRVAASPENVRFYELEKWRKPSSRYHSNINSVVKVYVIDSNGVKSDVYQSNQDGEIAYVQ